MTLEITCHFAGILALMFIGLSLRVIVFRYKHRIAMGDGGAKELHHAVRAQANFAEYTPLFLILLALVEAQGHWMPEWLMMGVGSVFVLARLSHAHSLLNVEQREGKLDIRFRQFGMVSTLGCITIFAVALLF